MSNKEHVLPARLKLFWGSGAMGVAMLMNGVSFLILIYLVSVLKLDPALAGTLVFLSKIIDAISDPIVGMLSDRSTFKSGRRRPFMFVGAFLAASSFGFLFAIPEFESQTMTAAYAFGCLVFYTIGYTVFNVPYMAMSAEMTDGYEERTSLHGYRVAFVSLGSALAVAGAPFVLELLGQSRESYAIIAVGMSAIIFLSLIACWAGTGSARTVERVHSRHNFLSQASLLFSNRHFVTLISVKALQLVGIMSTASVSFIFFKQYVGMDLRYFAAASIVSTLTTLIAVPLVKRLAARIGKKMAYFLSAGLTALVNLSWMLVDPAPPMDEFLPGFFLRMALSGVTIAGNVMLAMSMLTDTIEYDARVTGMRREGIYAAMYSFVEKLAAALAPFIVGWALAFAGYDKSLGADELQSGSALFGIMFGKAYLPAIMIGLSMFVLLFFKLDKETLHSTPKAAPQQPPPGQSPAQPVAGQT
ncbi:MAG: MFS transporter [Pseudomonadota bacterium]